MIPRSSALRASFAGLVGLGWAGQAFLHLQSGLITWDGGGIRRTGRLGMEPELWGALFFWFAAVSTVCAAGTIAAFQLAYLVVITAFGARRPH